MVTWHALDALSHQLELCGIDADTRAVVILDEALPTDRIALIRAAVARCGAHALDVRPVSDDNPLTHPLILALADATDVVITANQTYADALQDYGPAILLLASEIDPHQFPPHANLRRRVLALVDVVEQSAVAQLTDSYGTKVDIGLDEAKTTFDHGLINDTHLHGVYPSGWVAIEPAPQLVDGSVVLMPGDGNITAGCHISSPVTLDIIEGRLATIHGESPDADIIRAILEYADDPDGYRINHVGVGLNPGRSHVRAFDGQLLEPLLSRLAAGNITISFGTNTLSLALPGRSYTVDRLPLTTKGTLQGDLAPDVYETG